MYSLQCILIAKVFWDLVEGEKSLQAPWKQHTVSFRNFALWSVLAVICKKPNEIKSRMCVSVHAAQSKTKKGKSGEGTWFYLPLALTPPIYHIAAHHLPQLLLDYFMEYAFLSPPNLHFSSIFKNLCQVERGF